MRDKRPNKGQDTGSNDGADDKDGAAAWARLTGQTRPLDPARKNRRAVTLKAPRRARSKPTDVAPTPASRPALTRVRPAGAVAAAAPQADIPQKAKRRLARGGLEIDARLDLHGMTAAQARLALERFLGEARRARMVWVLVITGKGSGGEGVLRKSLADWLAEPALAAHVVEYAAAAPNHGGGGAFYLRLRRPR